MLVLKNIVKNYAVGDSEVKALKGIDIEFRKSEFVSILGPSGCGKTTLLNIIGGLDRYTSGDLIINGKSTEMFNDKDWDTYRNHSIGFVFQTYNLIPHQTVLSNVELALTLSGVSRIERKRRAIEALTKVGLADQLYKKPNQMSGGQMQRVAIARALVNDPDILLADEPTGALDSETSVQVMEILKEISKDKLIIMVTHNPELAEEYSSRIIRLLDGKVVSDTAPYRATEEEIAADLAENAEKRKKGKKPSMSFFTAFALSLNNLLTKKGRTIITAFAGSIGIIGIGLILSVSNGVQTYIDQIQQETIASAPITINRTEADMGSLISAIMGDNNEDGISHPTDDKRVYSSTVLAELMKNLSEVRESAKQNNLEAFKTNFLDTDEELNEYASAIQYVYDVNFNVYVKDPKERIIKSDIASLMKELYAGALGSEDAASEATAMFDSYGVWEEMLAGKDEIVSSTVKEQYTVVDGRWPEAKDEVILVVDENNEVSDMTLYTLGLVSKEELIASMMPGSAKDKGKDDIEIEVKSWSFEDLQKIDFRLILSADYFMKNTDGTYTDMSKTDNGREMLYANKSLPLKIVGIVKPSEEATVSMLNGSLAYTSELTQYIIENTLGSDIVKEQLENESIDVIGGKPFAENLTDAEKAEAWDAYASNMTNEEKKAVVIALSSIPDEETLASMVETLMGGYSTEELRSMIVEMIAATTGYDKETVNAGLTDENVLEYAREAFAAQAAEEYAANVAAEMSVRDSSELAALFDTTNNSLDTVAKAGLYDEYIAINNSTSTFDANLRTFGYATADNPRTIRIFAATFENKDRIADLITDYNNHVEDEADKITYTDYVKLLLSSITTIINAISYVLIAFVAISLVVSSIMIGIITYISVLERTKEIGILRAIGASKRDVSRVFDAETLIVGFVAGAIGIGVTVVLNLLITVVIQALTGIPSLRAIIPPVAAIVLVVISMLLTFIAGLIPSKLAAKKDPVVALRTE